jgi:hypothetical protein
MCWFISYISTVERHLGNVQEVGDAARYSVQREEIEWPLQARDSVEDTIFLT